MRRNVHNSKGRAPITKANASWVFPMCSHIVDAARVLGLPPASPSELAVAVAAGEKDSGSSRIADDLVHVLSVARAGRPPGVTRVF
jgi:hypothetical protein